MDEKDFRQYYRGFFISQFAALETTLELYIASYFVESEKKFDLMNIIINRLTFEAKRTALKTILDRKTPDFVKTKNNKWPSGEFLNELRKLNIERNIFAHYVLTTTVKPDAIISLREFRDKSETLEYTKVKYDSIIKRIYVAVEKLKADNIL